MNIEELLEQYFEGLTSAKEEATLRRFFTSGEVPENLMMYKPLFAHFDNEIEMITKGNGISESGNNIPLGNDAKSLLESEKESLPENKSLRIKTSRKFALWISGAAACAAILIGSFFFEPQSKKCSGEGDYVIINGRCYTDAKTIRSATLNSLREISGNGDDFAEGNSSENYETPESSETKRIIENQLKEFGSLFDE